MMKEHLKKNLLITMMLMIATLAIAACREKSGSDTQTDTFRTKSGKEITFTAIKHGSIRITFDGRVIEVDPVSRLEPTTDYSTMPKADYIFVTHEHYDHFSPEDIEKVAGKDTTLIVPESMKGKAQEASGLVKKIVTVKPGEDCEVEGLCFETVPAYNVDKKFHPKSNEWIGYILKTDGKRIYIAGDTDATPEARAVQCDVALVPVGGTYTMDAKKAADLINIIKPSVAIPTHYGSVVGKPSDAEHFAELVKEPVKVVTKIQYFD